MEMRKLINIVAENKFTGNTLPAMPSRMELDAFSRKVTGRSINDTHTLNWLLEIEPMTLRIVVAANIGFLEHILPHNRHDQMASFLGWKEFDWDTMLAPYAYERPYDADDNEDNDSRWHHIEQYRSDEIQQLLDYAGLDDVSMIIVDDNTMIMLDHDSHGRTGTDYSYSAGAPGMFYYGDPKKVIAFLKRAGEF